MRGRVGIPCVYIHPSIEGYQSQNPQSRFYLAVLEQVTLCCRTRLSPRYMEALCQHPLVGFLLASTRKVDFELVPVDMGAKEHKSDKFLALNPFGLVPAFEEGDFKLFESRAITQYIAHEYADKGTQLLLPGSNKSMAVLSMWKEVEANQFDPASSKLAWELVYKSFFGLTTDAAVVEENEHRLGEVLDVYETRLSQSKYLASDCFTLADLHHLPNIQFLLGSPAKKLFDSRPHVSTWVADIMARPAWCKVLALQKH